MVGLLLLAVFGLAKVAQAFFPIDVGAETTTSGSIHSVLGNVAFFALPVATVLLSRSRGRVETVVAVLLAQVLSNGVQRRSAARPAGGARRTTRLGRPPPALGMGSRGRSQHGASNPGAAWGVSRARVVLHRDARGTAS